MAVVVSLSAVALGNILAVVLRRETTLETVRLWMALAVLIVVIMIWLYLLMRQLRLLRRDSAGAANLCGLLRRVYPL